MPNRTKRIAKQGPLLTLQREQRLSLRQFRALQAIADHGGITSAAARLNLTQTAVSKAVAEIENVIGVPMLERHGRRVILAPAGQQVAQTSRRIGAEVRVLLEGIELLRSGAQGRVRIGVRIADARLLAKTITKFKILWPSATVVAKEGILADLLAELRAGEHDFVYGHIEPEQPDSALEGIGFDTPPAVVIASAGHPVLKQKRLNWREALTHAWCLPFKGIPIRDHFDSLLLASGLAQPTNVVEFGTAPMIALLLEEMSCLTALPESYVLPLAQRGIVGLTNLTIPTLTGKYGLSWSTEMPLGPAARAFRNIYADCLEIDIGRPVVRTWTEAD